MLPKNEVKLIMICDFLGGANAIIKIFDIQSKFYIFDFLYFWLFIFFHILAMHHTPPLPIINEKIHIWKVEKIYIWKVEKIHIWKVEIIKVWENVTCEMWNVK